MREQAAVTVVEARAAVTVEVWRRQGQPKRSPAGAQSTGWSRARSAVREGACTGGCAAAVVEVHGCAAEAHGCAGRRCMAGMPWRAVGCSRW